MTSSHSKSQVPSSNNLQVTSDKSKKTHGSYTQKNAKPPSTTMEKPLQQGIVSESPPSRLPETRQKANQPRIGTSLGPSPIHYLQRMFLPIRLACLLLHASSDMKRKRGKGEEKEKEKRKRKRRGKGDGPHQHHSQNPPLKDIKCKQKSFHNRLAPTDSEDVKKRHRGLNTASRPRGAPRSRTRTAPNITTNTKLHKDRHKDSS